MAAIVLKVRQTPKHSWITNFSVNGWKVRYNGAWLQMTPANTKVRSADGTAWLSVQ